jgi:hypothetical protein
VPVIMLHGAGSAAVRFRASAHIRIAEQSALLRASGRTRGIFGSAALVRLPRLDRRFYRHRHDASAACEATEAHQLLRCRSTWSSPERPEKGIALPEDREEPAPPVNSVIQAVPESSSRTRRRAPYRNADIGIAQGDDEAVNRLRDSSARPAR